MPANMCLDDGVLSRLLGETAEGESMETLKHVESCAACQRRMEEMSLQGLSWDEVKDFLTSGEGESIGDSEFDLDMANRRLMGTFLEGSELPSSIGRFARYEIVEILGRGGMGFVLKGFDPALNRYCAIKVMSPELAHSGSARQRFSREAISAAAVVHPNVVPILTVDDYKGLPYLVMPVVEGDSLQKRVEKAGPLSVIDAVRIAEQIAEGLAAAHAKGLVHRDIKPANILLDGVERVQITDFGLARAIDDASLTRSGVIAGTPQYMSPEQAHGDAMNDRSDLFSLGSVIYFMLTGHSPFRAETTMGVLNRIGNDKPRRLTSINPSVPEWLDGIVFKLLEKDPERRFGSASEVAELLGRWRGYLANPSDVVSPAVTRRSFSLPRFWENKIALVAMGCFAAMLAGIIFIESGKGTIRIENNSQMDVPIRIRKGKEVVEKLMVHQKGAKVRLAAGEYIVEFDGEVNGIKLENGIMTLMRGEQWVAKLSELAARSDVDLRTPMPSPEPGLDYVGEMSSQPIWEHENRVRLGHGFAELKLKLPSETRDKINDLLTETWKKCIELERQYARYSKTPEGHLVVDIAEYKEWKEPGITSFLLFREALDNEYWSKLDEITGGKPIPELHAMSTMNGSPVRSDEWKGRKVIVPSLLGWHETYYPARIEIWKKGTWFHWKVKTRGDSTYGDGEKLPFQLQHYFDDGQAVLTADEPEAIAGLPEETQVHVVGCYRRKGEKPIEVRVRSTGKPMVIVLTAYFSADWNLVIDEGADVRGVILSGYFEQHFAHLGPLEGMPTRVMTYFPVWPGITPYEKSIRNSRCFSVWSPLGEDYGKMASVLKKLTGHTVTSYQSSYQAEEFEINSATRQDLAKLASRWVELSQDADRTSAEYVNVSKKLQTLLEGVPSNAKSIEMADQVMENYRLHLMLDPSVDEESAKQ